MPASDFDKYNPYSYRALEKRIKSGENIHADDLVDALKFNVPNHVEMPVLILEHVCLRLAGKIKRNGRPTLSIKEKSHAVVNEQLAVDYYYRAFDVFERIAKEKSDDVGDETLAVQAAKATLALFFKGERNMSAISFRNNVLTKYPDPRKRN